MPKAFSANFEANNQARYPDITLHLTANLSVSHSLPVLMRYNKNYVPWERVTLHNAIIHTFTTILHFIKNGILLA